ncbi:MAG: hypothetical protein HQL64_16170 [Magnetococcales bacterium]|nr:hypothetical protein [Magnetococcales bacterium]
MPISNAIALWLATGPLTWVVLGEYRSAVLYEQRRLPRWPMQEWMHNERLFSAAA